MNLKIVYVFCLCADALKHQILGIIFSQISCVEIMTTKIPKSLF
jgi:hypothetical protein